MGRWIFLLYFQFCSNDVAALLFMSSPLCSYPLGKIVPTGTTQYLEVQ